MQTTKAILTAAAFAVILCANIANHAAALEPGAQRDGLDAGKKATPSEVDRSVRDRGEGVQTRDKRFKSCKKDCPDGDVEGDFGRKKHERDDKRAKGDLSDDGGKRSSPRETGELGS